jgi:hypothetical protein
MFTSKIRFFLISIDIYDVRMISTAFQLSRDCDNKILFDITNIDKCSQTQLLIFVLLRGVFTQLVLTTTCFSRCIDHHQVVHFLIFKANYTIYNVYCIVCFKNKRMYNLMMAYITAETCCC